MALTLSFLAVGVEHGDEVIIPNRTFVATAHAALLIGARVVLVDTLQDSPLLDVSKVAAAISPRTKVIVPVHLNGRAVDMRALAALAAAHRIAIVEDAAQATLSKYENLFLGTLGDLGCYSFGMSKLLSTGQGGMIVTARKDLYERVRLIRNQGVADVFQTTFRMPGFNAKFTDLQAAMGRVQLERAGEKSKRVIEIYQQYAAEAGAWPFLKLVPVDIATGALPLWIEVVAHDRERLQTFLLARGVETRRFLPDLHLSPHLHNSDHFQCSKHFDAHGLFLPGGPAQSKESIEEVLRALREYRRLSPDDFWR